MRSSAHTSEQSQRESAKTKATIHDCLVRICLGGTLRNFPLNLVEMLELELPLDELLAVMADALAMMHMGKSRG